MRIEFDRKNWPEVKNLLHKIAIAVRDKIKEEVRSRVISLQVDIVTKNRRAIFGITIQYVANGKVRVRSIGVIELLQSHTTQYLADVICARLKIYEIDLKQILTITTDNGTNFLKMVREIDAILQDAIINETNSNDADNFTQMQASISI